MSSGNLARLDPEREFSFFSKYPSGFEKSLFSSSYPDIHSAELRQFNWHYKSEKIHGIQMASKMSEETPKQDDHQMEDDLMEQIMTALESANGHKYVGYFPEQSATRIKRIEPDNSVLLDLYNNNPKARELIDAFVNSAPYDLAIKLGLPARGKD